MATTMNGGIPAADPQREGAAEPVAAPLAAMPPAHRRLQVFSLDPGVDVRLEDSLVSRSVLPVAWESVAPGPTGEYVEVVDVDPSSCCAYDPVDLNDPHLLAQDGLSPSAGNPQFHQQMVYAVAMETIANFERVLGRKVLWAERRYDENGARITDPALRYVPRLRLYPHALRDENAYYSPAKVALLFGYFNARSLSPAEELPNGIVFTCLSHDIIAHEMTHAILDGMHRRMLDASNVDMVAFHEAFADIVAIFQHFTLPGLLLDQIQRSRGNLRSNLYLAQLAGQFARATGQGDALRNALGFDEHGHRESPDPTALARTVEPHERGAILVAAVFDAFVRMYEDRVADLRRIATGGTGVLPEGDIHPDLARRFAEEAVRLSQRVVNMAIRAVDYLPPVDVTFGDFLRALITADADFFPDDPRRYRLAFIEAFRNRGIYPLDVRALAEDALRWTPVDKDVCQLVDRILPPTAVLRTMATAYDSGEMARLIAFPGAEGDGGELRRELLSGSFDRSAQRFIESAWRLDSGPSAPEREGDRRSRYLMERRFAAFLHDWMVGKARSQGSPKGEESKRLGWHLGLDLQGLAASDGKERRLEVHAVRPTVRLRADGRSKLELLIVLTQGVSLSLADGKPLPGAADDEALSFWFRGGTTLILDPEAGEVRYSVAKNILSEGRQRRQMEYLRNEVARLGSPAVVRHGLTREARSLQRELEPFALAHARSNSYEQGTY